MAQQQYLTDDEIKRFLDDLDHNGDGTIDYSEVERMLDEVHKEIAPKAQPHHLHHKSRGDEARHEFLRSVIGSRENRIKRDQFAESVKKWEIPSLEQDRKEAKEEDDYLKQMSIYRRARAWWAVRGAEVAFLALVASFMVAFGVWQLVKYLTSEVYTPAFGWGAVMAKTCAGVLYPTFFFLILSMSRWLATFLRRFYFISRFVNWDLSQSFHIKMSMVALCFVTLHAIGHLTGSFVFGSMSSRQEAVGNVLGQDAVPRRYYDYVRSLPGWSGLTAISLFYLLTALSMPQVRKWSYEVFQLGHLLMFPIIGLLMAHGTAGLLQFPMFGYWLAFPTLLVIFERTWRTVSGFRPIEAELELLDKETVVITAEIPQISRWQWHPFTVSTCINNRMQVHIKADGDWTNELRDLATNGNKLKIKIGLDGPFGAPAQRFYDFEYSMVFGAGIGVTPFSGVLTDLQYHELERSKSSEQSPDLTDGATAREASPYEGHRRVDFHWMVRDRNNLMWFSDLLNEVSRAQEQDHSHLDIRVQTYVTQKRKNISQHVFRWLLEKHRTDDYPYSPITGLVNPTHFGRPDIRGIMEEHYSDMCKVLTGRTPMNEKPDGRRSSKTRRTSMVDEEVRVGVFFCGPPVIGQQLADQCSQMTAKARNEGRKIEYRFMIEVFG
ncbi:ferric reductase NAD binding domain-containing protein [Ampelomyces quisqualis]|uniref:Ferric reductase NAD binding domain-containing protein n=1 Tax=Ampelomyces quisqualis TaxID=50730 RepID=A0A6A5QWF6_AMPQU|nr:ferric reductase NAD binding domain-containing protein [Ampelomyces quisqualis]